MMGGLFRGEFSLSSYFLHSNTSGCELQLYEGRFQGQTKTQSDAIKQKLEHETARRCSKTPGSGRTRRGESFLRLAASPDTTPTMTPSPGWDCGTRSGSKTRKNGIPLSLPAHGATYLSKSFPREKPRAFFGPGRSRGEKKGL